MLWQSCLMVQSFSSNRHSLVGDMFSKELEESFAEMGRNILVNLGARRRKFTTQNRLDGKLIVITGATRSVGKEAALICSSLGAKVVIPCRDTSLGHSVAQEIIEAGHPAPLVVEMDLASLESVAKAAREIKKKTDKVDAFINNAGILTFKKRLTSDSIESMVQINYVGHFLLTKALLPSLNKSPDPKVIFVSSLIHHKAGRKGLNFGDFFKQSKFKPTSAYSQSKLACLMFCRTLSKEQPNVSFYAVDPGMFTSEITRNFPRIYQLLQKHVMPSIFLRTLTEAASSVTGPLFLPKSSYDRDRFYFGDAEAKNCSSSVFNDDLCGKMYHMSEKLVANYFSLPQENWSKGQSE